MRKKFSIGFFIKATIVGLLFALIYLWPNHDYQRTNDKPIQQPALALQQGPVSYADAVNKASGAVVNIYTAKTVQKPSHRFSNPLFQQFFGNSFSRSKPRVETGTGSGVIFSADGYIITNYHVIKSAQQIRVLLHDGRDFAATEVGSDPETDLAVIRIIADQLSTISLSNLDHLQVGDVVLAIGNPFGVGQTVTMGIVSATGRDRIGLNTFENFIQTDAAINPGNSGGALINAYGNLVGINSAIFSKSGGSHGIGFAIPANMAKNILSQIINNGRVERGWLGVEARNLSPAAKQHFGINGVIVGGIFRNGPADIAGILPGDIITYIAQKPVLSIRDMLNIISSNKPGQEVTIDGMRNGKKYQTTARVIQRPSSN